MKHNNDMKRHEYYKRKYLNFLFSDHKAIPYWIFIFIFCLVFMMVAYLKTSKFEVLGTLFICIGIYVGFYTVSYFRYNTFFKLKEILKSKGFEVRSGQCKISLMSKGLIMSSPLQNYSAKIKLNSYDETCVYLQTTDFFVLFYPIRELGVFQYYVPPVVVNQSGVLPSYLHSFKLKIVVCQNVTRDGDKVVISLDENHNIYLHGNLEY